MVVFQQSATLASQQRNDSPFGLRQFALRTLRFAKSGYKNASDFAIQNPAHSLIERNKILATAREELKRNVHKWGYRI
jgi:hypothetical protein